MAKRWNCSNKFKGRKVNKVYLDVLMLLSWKEKEKVFMNKLSYKGKHFTKTYSIFVSVVMNTVVGNNVPLDFYKKMKN